LATAFGEECKIFVIQGFIPFLLFIGSMITYVWYYVNVICLKATQLEKCCKSQIFLHVMWFIEEIGVMIYSVSYFTAFAVSGDCQPSTLLDLSMTFLSLVIIYTLASISFSIFKLKEDGSGGSLNDFNYNEEGCFGQQCRKCYCCFSTVVCIIIGIYICGYLLELAIIL